ncbi:MAG: hypothetical protein L6266_05090, partial [Nanoarchaeota archaeon]|nr:hypothetical protein [Nanoarchaeota archaeon]
QHFEENFFFHKKFTLKEMQEIAKKKKGKCLSKKYIDNRTNLHWQCKLGHKWKATPANIKKGRWCQKCYNLNRSNLNSTKLTLKEMQEIAKQRGGKCLSKEYINNRKNLHWQCDKCGHNWDARPGNIKLGQWCPKCAGILPHTLKDMKEFAKKKKGKCLSKEYTNNRTRLKWECKNKHIWEARPLNVINLGRWCPICSQGVSERICRDIFETIFKKNFPKSRPKWLKNKRKYQMELDGFCKSLNLAFEYQGIQHFEENFFFHKKFTLKQRKSDDKEKRKLCKLHNIKLIIVPFKIKQEDQPKYIIEKCKQLGIKVPKITPNLNDCLKNIYAPEILKEMKELAKKRGGKCLSKNYINSQHKLKWKCNKCGHKWGALVDNIKNKKSWCQKCAIKKIANKRKDSIENMQEIAKKRGGKCLSKKYINTHLKLKWKCNKCGYEWKALPSNIKRGSWCPSCVGQARSTLKDIKKLAKKKKIKCLSKKYINAKTKMKWQCNKCDYKWRATYSSIAYLRKDRPKKKIGTWCPKCKIKLKKKASTKK